MSNTSEDRARRVEEYFATMAEEALRVRARDEKADKEAAEKKAAAARKKLIKRLLMASSCSVALGWGFGLGHDSMNHEANKWYAPNHVAAPSPAAVTAYQKSSDFRNQRADMFRAWAGDTMDAINAKGASVKIAIPYQLFDGVTDNVQRRGLVKMGWMAALQERKASGAPRSGLPDYLKDVSNYTTPAGYSAAGSKYTLSSPYAAKALEPVPVASPDRDYAGPKLAWQAVGAALPFVVFGVFAGVGALGQRKKPEEQPSPRGGNHPSSGFNDQSSAAGGVKQVAAAGGVKQVTADPFKRFPAPEGSRNAVPAVRRLPPPTRS